MVERISDFRSQGLRCAGTLVLPETVVRPPIIIMGHGFAAERCFSLPQFAADFARAGYAVYYFDYRNFGGSEGQPRHWVDPARHQQDWRAAIAHVKTFAEINPDKIAIWGSSFGGGHVLQIASEQTAIAAVIAQVPHVSGVATMANIPISNLLKASAYGALDLAGAALLGKPHYSPVIGRTGSFAAMTSPESWDGYFSMVPKEARWENKVLSRVFLKLAFFSPIKRAHKIRVPTLVIAGSEDSVTPPAAAEQTASKIPGAEFQLLPCNHFQVYQGEFYQRNMALQIDFLKRHLG